MIIYYIYHLPHLLRKDGSIGKIGVSEKPRRRTKVQGYDDYEILEEHTCIYKVSDREIELQKEYGYTIDPVLYWQSVADREGRIKAGKKIGDTNVINGHLAIVRKIANNNRCNAVLVYTKSGNFIGEYKSQTECCNELNLSSSRVSEVSNGIKKSTSGYVIKYKT
jgi:hypothetical protein